MPADDDEDRLSDLAEIWRGERDRGDQDQAVHAPVDHGLGNPAWHGCRHSAGQGA
jgi:hypothetical protein